MLQSYAIVHKKNGYKTDTNIWKSKACGWSSVKWKMLTQNFFGRGTRRRGINNDFNFMPHKLILWLYNYLVVRVSPKYSDDLDIDYGGDNERVIKLVIWLGPCVTVLKAGWIYVKSVVNHEVTSTYIVCDCDYPRLVRVQVLHWTEDVDSEYRRTWPWLERGGKST